MSEWWTYSLSDFLLFSPRTYYRMIERHNAAVWPGQVFAAGLGIAIVGLLRRPGRRQGRVSSGILALLWAWVAWRFLAQQYATINWAASYLAWLFGLEVALLVWTGLVRGRLSFRLGRDAASAAGLALFIASLALYPLLAPLLRRGWGQAEVFGVVPDPTVLGTLGILLLTEGHPRWDLLAVPLLWCVVSGATLWAMGSPEAWIVGGAGVLVFAASGRAALGPRSSC